MEWSEVRKLVKLVENSEIQELELEREGIRIRIRKHDETPAAQAVVYPQPIQMPQQGNQPEKAMPALEAPQQTVKEARESKSNLHEVKAPMVGSYYRAPSPDADPYVHVGDLVKPGQTLCIIEAMKLMNEIEADTTGRIVEILCENEEPVEFGQPLFLIDPKG